MKSPFLIFLLIFNLLAVSTASAINAYDEELAESRLTQSQSYGDHEAGQETALASCIDEASCDHFCHFSSHLMGYISDLPSLVILETPIEHTSHNRSFYSLILELRVRPPQA